MEWLRTHYESVSGRSGYADFYKRDLQLKMLDPIGTVCSMYNLLGCQIVSSNYGDLDYGSDEAVEVAITIQPDNVVMLF